VRIAVAAVWHVPVILYLFGLYAVWARNMPEGFPTMLRGTLLSLLAGVLGLVTMHLIDNLFRGGLHLSADLQPQLPGAKTRFRKHLPALRAGARWLIYAGVALGVLEAWELGGFVWFWEQLGRTLVTAASLVLTILVAVVLSELGVNVAPMLAAAGVFGLAVGFGSQKLVQDVITCFFILLEDVFALAPLPPQ
jgi:small-conductance mechanosensitive channel